MSDFSSYKQLEIARVNSSAEITNPAGPVSQSHTRERALSLANLSASSAEGVSGGSIVPYAAALKTMRVVANLAAVANTTDYSSVNLFKRTGNGAAVLMATANLANVTVTKLVPVSGVLVANVANTTLAAGDVITANCGLTGNGTANNAQCTVDFTFEDV